MESLNNIIQTLELMVDAHIRLRDLAKEKRAHLVEGDMVSLQSLIQRERTYTDEIQKLELQRKRFVQEYMVKKGFTGQFFTLEELLKVKDDPTNKNTLHIISKQLRLLIDEITQINESNQQLIQTSLTYIEYSIGLLARKEPAIGYGPKATDRFSNLLDAKA